MWRAARVFIIRQTARLSDPFPRLPPPVPARVPPCSCSIITFPDCGGVPSVHHLHLLISLQRVRSHSRLLSLDHPPSSLFVFIRRLVRVPSLSHSRCSAPTLIRYIYSLLIEWPL